MKGDLFKVVIVVVLTTLGSCSGKKPSGLTSIRIDPKDSQSLMLSEFFEEINYVFLDDSDTLPLVNPYKISFKGDLILVSDNVLDNIHVFNDSGERQFSLQSLGQGPMEFSHLEDFFVHGDSIIIKDNVLKKLLIFDLKGQVLGEQKFKLLSAEFFYHPFFRIYYLENNEAYNFAKIDSDDNILERDYQVDQNILGFKLLSNHGFQKDSFRNLIFFNIPYTYHVAVFNELGKMVNILEFDFGTANISSSQHARFGHGYEKRNFVEQHQLVEMITCFFPFRNGYFVFFIQSNKVWHFVWLDNNFKVIQQAKSFNNDLDLMKIRTIPWSYDEEYVVFMTRSIDLYNDFKERENEIRTNYPSSQIISFYEKYKEKLQDDKTVLVKLKINSNLNPL
jgi:hypothetical protein